MGKDLAHSCGRKFVRNKQFFVLRRNLYVLRRKLYNSRRNFYNLRRKLKNLLWHDGFCRVLRLIFLSAESKKPHL